MIVDPTTPKHVQQIQPVERFCICSYNTLVCQCAPYREADLGLSAPFADHMARGDEDLPGQALQGEWVRSGDGEGVELVVGTDVTETQLNLLRWLGPWHGTAGHQKVRRPADKIH